MSAVAAPTFLRRGLLADGLTSAACGALMVFGAGMLAPWLGLPQSLLLAAGSALFPFAALLVWIARRAQMPRAAVGLVIALNVLWAIACLLLAFGTVALAPTSLGIAFLAIQALAVIAFADLEWMGLRRDSRPASA